MVVPITDFIIHLLAEAEMKCQCQRHGHVERDCWTDTIFCRHIVHCALKGITFIVYMSSSRSMRRWSALLSSIPLRFLGTTLISSGRCLIKYADVELRSASPGTGGLPAEVRFTSDRVSCNNSEFDVVIVEDEIVLLDRTVGIGVKSTRCHIPPPRPRCTAHPCRFVLTTLMRYGSVNTSQGSVQESNGE